MKRRVIARALNVSQSVVSTRVRIEKLALLKTENGQEDKRLPFQGKTDRLSHKQTKSLCLLIKLADPTSRSSPYQGF